MADILREVAKDLNFNHEIIPNRLEIKDLMKKKEEAAAKAAEQGDKALQATQIQMEGQKEMDMGTLKLKEMEVQLKAQQKKIDQMLKSQEIKSKDQALMISEENKRNVSTMVTKQKDMAQKREIALKIQEGEGI